VLVVEEAEGRCGCRDYRSSGEVVVLGCMEMGLHIVRAEGSAGIHKAGVEESVVRSRTEVGERELQEGSRSPVAVVDMVAAEAIRIAVVEVHSLVEYTAAVEEEHRSRCAVDHPDIAGLGSKT